MKKLTISKLASAAGVNIETIRYYQHIGLLPVPAKPVSGYRTYSEDAIGTIKFIKRAQRLGFNLTEIAELLNLGSGHCEDIQHQAVIKREQIRRQIEDLQSLQSTLDQLILSCEVSGAHTPCPIVDSLRNTD